MSGAELRNPQGRWTVWLIVGLALSCALASIIGSATAEPCVDDFGQPCKFSPGWLVVLFFGWFPLGFFVAAFASFWARTVIAPEGLVTRSLFGSRTYRWDEIAQVVNFTERWYGSGIRASTERSVRLKLANGKIRDLPAPKAGRFIGRDAFEEGTRQIFEAWKRETGGNRSTLGG